MDIMQSEYGSSQQAASDKIRIAERTGKYRPMRNMVIWSEFKVMDEL